MPLYRMQSRSLVFLFGIVSFVSLLSYPSVVLLHPVAVPSQEKVVLLDTPLPKKRKNPFHSKKAAPIQIHQNFSLPAWMNPTDKVLERGYERSPIVLEEFKLLFFTVPKNACTVWKQLFRRMMGLADWRRFKRGVPHNPDYNGLTYLSDYYQPQNQTAMALLEHMWTSPDWTRAIFVRDPKERFVSAYLDKAFRKDGFELRKWCCEGIDNLSPRDCVRESQQSIEAFLKRVQTTCASNDHWDPQSSRMEPPYWKYINFVGHFDALQVDAERLLRRVGAWDKYGRAGWGQHKNESLFQGYTVLSKHTTGASAKMKQYLTPSLELQLEDHYQQDYDLEVLNLTRKRFTTADAS